MTSGIIAMLFVVVKLLEAKFLKKEHLPLKKVGRDGILVYVATLAGIYVSEMLESSVGKSSTPGAYTDSPEF